MNGPAQVPIPSSILAAQYDLSARAIRVNLEGISEEEALIEPTGGGNCVNWILGHVISSREQVLHYLGEAELWEEDLAGRYGRGSDAIRGVAPATVESMLEVLKRSQRRILNSLESMSEATLRDSIESASRGDHLARLQFHESYHAGQIGIVRRILGHEGAIK